MSASSLSAKMHSITPVWLLMLLLSLPEFSCTGDYKTLWPSHYEVLTPLAFINRVMVCLLKYRCLKKAFTDFKHWVNVTFHCGGDKVHICIRMTEYDCLPCLSDDLACKFQTWHVLYWQKRKCTINGSLQTYKNGLVAKISGLNSVLINMDVLVLFCNSVIEDRTREILSFFYLFFFQKKIFWRM